MDRKIFWGVSALIVLITAFSMFWSGDDPARNSIETLPWHIQHPTPDTTRVFRLTLGQSTVTDAEKVFLEPAKISLFKSPEGKLVIEGFFQEIKLNGLKAGVFVSIAVPATEMQAMFDRGIRMYGTGSGKKVTLEPDDEVLVRTLPISSLTYIPSIRLEEDMITKRFGVPAQRVRETKSGAIHWLYPQHGLDITLGGKEKTVLQYLSPGNFTLLSQPLLAQGELLP